MIIITGASGFIGQHLFNHFTSLNIPVIGFSRTNSKFSLVEKYSDIYIDRPSTLIHLAQTASTNGLIDVDFEINDFRNLLKNRWKKVIYFSSATLYGSTKTNRHQTSSELSFETDYKKVKLASEDMVNKINGIVFRLTNAYGCGMSAKTVLGDIFSQLDSGHQVILKNAYSVRDFIYIDDVISCVKNALEYSGKGVFNLGSGSSYSIYELASIILTVAGSNQSITSLQKLEKYTDCLSVDVSNTVKQLNWVPIIDLYSGIRKILMNHEKFK
jgi:nucleoside-diphosphate-sugar epimerase